MITNTDIRTMGEKMLHRAIMSAKTQADDAFLRNQFSMLKNVEVFGIQASGNFTVVAVNMGGIISVGVAKRNPLDAPDPQRGARLAASRALKKALSL